jgi:hypothetical protein
MQMRGLFDVAAAGDFVQACLEVQDAPISTILAVIPPLWEKLS